MESCGCDGLLWTLGGGVRVSGEDREGGVVLSRTYCVLSFRRGGFMGGAHGSLSSDYRIFHRFA